MFGMTLGILHVYTDGFVIRHLWNWFLSPALEVPRLTQVAAMGMDLLVSLMISPLFAKLSKIYDTVREGKYCGSELVLMGLKGHMTSLIIWVFGYLLHLYL